MIKLGMVTPIQVPPELWASTMMPEGILERWLIADGGQVWPGDPVATVRIESALHDLMAPCKGRLHIDRRIDSVIEPGAVIGHIDHTIHA
ncbi:MAG TPA: hypothetical protein VGC16_10695 [Rhizomicrobium sp.]